MVEETCQMTQFIQDIVPFCIAIIDGQHWLGITADILENTFMDILVPVEREAETMKFYFTSSLHNPQKVVFMISSGLLSQTIELFQELGRSGDSILSASEYNNN